MNSTRLYPTICFVLACFLVTGSALAGTTTATEVTYARETSAADVDYTLPANTLERAMNVVRDDTEDFVLKVSLGQGAVFDAAGEPVATDLDLSDAQGCAISPSIVDGGTAGDAFVDFLVNITTSCTGFPTLEVTTTGWVIQDVDNTLGSGGPIDVTMETRDSATNNVFDSGSDTDDWLFSVFAIVQGEDEQLVSTTATIDVATARLEFIPQGTGNEDNQSDQDRGATLGFETTTPGVLAPDGNDYELDTADTIDLVITGDLSGISDITFAPNGTATSVSPTESDVTNGSVTLSLPGTHGALQAPNNPVGLWITVDGTTTLNPRTLNISANLTLVTAPGVPDNSRELFSSTPLTVWGLNGTVLIANFMNGNNGLFNSRVYLWNPSSIGGSIEVRVYTLPLSGASILLGTVSAGTLPSNSGRNLRLAEDVLTPLGITLPYTDNGGNLVLEITVNASDVIGYGQVFQLDLSSFGIYPLVVFD